MGALFFGFVFLARAFMENNKTKELLFTGVVFITIGTINIVTGLTGSVTKIEVYKGGDIQLTEK